MRILREYGAINDALYWNGANVNLGAVIPNPTRDPSLCKLVYASSQGSCHAFRFASLIDKNPMYQVLLWGKAWSSCAWGAFFIRCGLLLQIGGGGSGFFNFFPD